MKDCETPRQSLRHHLKLAAAMGSLHGIKNGRRSMVTAAVMGLLAVEHELRGGGDADRAEPESVLEFVLKAVGDDSLDGEESGYHLSSDD